MEEGIAWRPDSLVSHISRLSEYGHGVHYFSPDFGSSAVGIIKQSVNSLGIRHLAAQWAWTCTAKR